jgi:hypothetical protein
MRSAALSANLLSSLKKCGLCRRKAYGDSCLFPHLIAPPAPRAFSPLADGQDGAQAIGLQRIVARPLAPPRRTPCRFSRLPQRAPAAPPRGALQAIWRRENAQAPEATRDNRRAAAAKRRNLSDNRKSC